MLLAAEFDSSSTDLFSSLQKCKESDIHSGCKLGIWAMIGSCSSGGSSSQCRLMPFLRSYG